MTEDKIEQNSLEILAELGWTVLNGPNIGPDGSCRISFITSLMVNLNNKFL
jgi:hypothetical protein